MSGGAIGGKATGTVGAFRAGFRRRETPILTIRSHKAMRAGGEARSSSTLRLALRTPTLRASIGYNVSCLNGRMDIPYAARIA